MAAHGRYCQRQASQGPGGKAAQGRMAARGPALTETDLSQLPSVASLQHRPPSALPPRPAERGGPEPPLLAGQHTLLPARRASGSPGCGWNSMLAPGEGSVCGRDNLPRLLGSHEPPAERETSLAAQCCRRSGLPSARRANPARTRRVVGCGHKPLLRAVISLQRVPVTQARLGSPEGQAGRAERSQVPEFASRLANAPGVPLGGRRCGTTDLAAGKLRRGWRGWGGAANRCIIRRLQGPRV